MTQMPMTGMEPITVPGAFDGWVTLLERYGTMKLADLLAPAIEYAEQGFPVMEKIAADWEPEVAKLKSTPAAAATYLVDGGAPRSRARSSCRRTSRARSARWPAAAATRSTAARSASAIVDYCQANGGFLSMEDLAAQKAEWVEPISTTYRGHTLYELPPNGQGLTALLLLNILEPIDLAAMRDRAGPLLPHADRGDQDRLRRSQPVHRRSGVREDPGEGAAVEGVRRAAGAR